MTAEPRPPFAAQQQERPGSTAEMAPALVAANILIAGNAKLKGRVALITGAEPGYWPRRRDRIRARGGGRTGVLSL